MMTAEPKPVVRRVIEEVITGGRLDLIEDLFTDREAARARAWITPFRQAFPDVRMEIVELVAEGEIVVGRFRCSATHLGKWGDREPTGRRFEGVDEVYFFTVTDGRVARMWGLEDTLERKRQLGLEDHRRLLRPCRSALAWIDRTRGEMRIGIIGAGRIGHALGVRFAAAGHEVMLSNSRGPETLDGVVASIDGNARAGTVAEAARFGEVAVVAIPTQAIWDLPPEPFTGRLVIDANNYYPQPGRPVRELDADETTSSELLASLLPGATVVKAFNTIYFGRLLQESHPDLPAEERLAIPVAGDSAEAKRTVAGLIDEIGFTAVDAGTLAETRRQQPGSLLYVAFAESRREGVPITAPRLGELLSES